MHALSRERRVHHEQVFFIALAMLTSILGESHLSCFTIENQSSASRHSPAGGHLGQDQELVQRTTVYSCNAKTTHDNPC